MNDFPRKKRSLAVRSIANGQTGIAGLLRTQVDLDCEYVLTVKVLFLASRLLKIRCMGRRARIGSLGCWAFIFAVIMGCSNSTATTAVPGTQPDSTKRPNFAAAPSIPQTKTHIHFTEVAENSGINWTVRNGEESGRMAIVETLGAGCATTDYDRDGRLDIFVLGGGQYGGERELQSLPMALFRQQEHWQFVAVQEFARLPTPRFYHHGAFTADVDNDGFPDLLITGYGGLQLFSNQGDGTFTDITSSSGLEDKLWSTAAAWADLNDDGALDLFVGHYVNWSIDNHPVCSSVVTNVRDVCSPTVFKGEPCSVFMSRGDGTFRDASHELGIDLVGKSLGVVIASLTGDGPLEIYVANDTEPNQLYQRQPDKRYSDVALVSGVALGEMGESDGSMGVDVGDLDGDGRLDLWVANFEDQSFALYRNLGNHLFAHSSRAFGVTAVGRLAVGFGTVIFDADGDGYLDIFCSNGHVHVGTPLEHQMQLPFLFVNDHGKRFRNLAASSGDYFQQKHIGRGAASADLDHNGSLDLVVTHNNAPVAVLRNDTNIGNWLAIRLVGIESCRDAIGARITVHCGDKQQVMVIKGGGSFLSTSDLAPLFGLGDHNIADRIEIRWPSGGTQIIEKVSSRKTLIVMEGKNSLSE